MALSALLVVQLKYFIYLAAPFLCLAMAAPLDAAWGRIEAVARDPGRRIGLAVVAIGALGLVGYEPYTHYRAMNLMHWKTKETLDLLEWVRDNTPPVDPEQPEYAVLNTWESGFWISAVAERPNYANNFVAAPPESVYIQHLTRAYDWLIARDANPLYDAMDRHRLDYLVALPIDAKAIYGYLSLTGREHDEFVRYDEAHETWTTTEGLNDTVLARLLLVQGREIANLPCVDGLQLLKTTERTMPLAGQQVPVAQFYRRVQGALITGRASPGETVRVGTGRVALNTGPHAHFAFSFECTTKAKSDGTFSLRFPYASVQVGDVAPASPILLWRGERGPNNPPVTLNISDEDVTAGKSIALP